MFTKVTGPLCALQAGCCASLASLSAKTATSYDAAESITKYVIYIGSRFADLELDPTQNVEEGILFVRLLGIVGIFLFNSLMWVLFTKSMHLCSSTLEATAFNTSSNFIFTALVGKLLFSEHLSWQWCLGSVLIVLGLVVLHQGSSHSQSTDHGTEGSQENYHSKKDVKRKES